jgi:hypothetical protein
MDTVLIPNTSVSISRLGFGCARIFGGRELRSAATLIDAAIRCGIRHFDTAPAYGSEDVLGTVLADANDVTIATKIGLPRFSREGSAVRRIFGPLYRGTLRPLLSRAPTVKSRLLQLAAKPAGSNSPIARRQLRRDEVLRNLDDSLRRLRRKALDLYLLHEPETIEITDELREVFVSLQKDGLIKAFGLAFGALPTHFGSFGTVVQSRFPGDAPIFTRPETIRIYHGVVRFGLQRGVHEGTRPSAAGLIARTLQRHAASTVIFSASSQRQIHQISETCRQTVARPAT